MLITAPCVVSLTWRLEDTLGELIDELSEPTEFYYGGDDLLPKVEEALLGQEAGYNVSLHLEPEHAFGDYDADLVFFENRALFGEAIEPGMQFEGPPEGSTVEGMPVDKLYTVTEVYPEHVVLDGNHALAGIALRIDITVREVREATPEEIEAESAADPEVVVLPSAPEGTSLH